MKVKASLRIFGGHQGSSGKKIVELDLGSQISVRDVIRRLQAEQLWDSQESFLTDEGELLNSAVLSVAGRTVASDELGKSLNQFGEDEVDVDLDLVLIPPIVGG